MFLDEVQERLISELKRVGPPVIAGQTGIARATLYNWMEKGNMPLDKLALLQSAGVDALYILTGRHSGRAPTPAPARPLSRRAQALVDNYEASDETGKRYIERAADHEAQSGGKKAARGGQ